MKHAKFFFIALFTLIFVSLAHAQIIAIKAGKLVNPETGTTQTNQIILVEKGKITAVGAGLQIPKDASVIDLSNQTVLPGLSIVTRTCARRFRSETAICLCWICSSRRRFVRSGV